MSGQTAVSLMEALNGAAVRGGRCRTAGFVVETPPPPPPIPPTLTSFRKMSFSNWLAAAPAALLAAIKRKQAFEIGADES